MSNRHIILAFVSKRKMLVALALLANVLDSCVNAALLLSVGKYLSVQSHENSAKSGIFDFLFSAIQSSQALLFFFIGAVTLKALLTVVDYWLSQRLGDEFVSHLRQLSLQSAFEGKSLKHMDEAIQRLSQSASGDMQNVRDFFTKGFLEFSADFSYLLILCFLFYVVNPKLMLCFLVALPLFALCSFMLGKGLSKAKKIRSDKRSSLHRNAERIRERLVTIVAFNQAKREGKRWYDKEMAFQGASNALGISQGFSESILPILFFGLIGFVLFVLEPTSHSKTSITSFILLLLYAQGSLRRSMRVYTVWSLGHESLAKLNITAKILDSEEDEGSFEMHKAFWKSTSGSAVELKKGEMLFVNQNLSHLELANLFLFPSHAHALSLIDAENKAPQVKQWRKTISVVSADVPFHGKSIWEWLLLSNASEEKKLKAQHLLEQWQLGFLTSAPSTHIPALTKVDKLKIQLVRLRMNGRKIVVLHSPFDGLSKAESLTLADCLVETKKNRIVLIYGNTFPEGLPVKKLDEIDV